MDSKPPSEPAGVPELLFGDLWDYAPAAESTDAVSLEPRYGHFIRGKFVAGENHVAAVNPATEETLCEAAAADGKAVNRAVRAARDAFQRHWAPLGGLERGKVLYRIGRLIQERAGDLALLETLDTGKPVRAVRSLDVPMAAAHFLYHAGWADKIGHVFPGATAVPLGVVAQVLSGSSPLLGAARKIAPALAAGNTVVVKPSQNTPCSAMRLAEIFREAGLPPGVVNILNGGGDTGDLLVAHRDVDRVAFSGSAAVGKQVRRALAGVGKRLTLDLGGKGVHILFEDAALDQAVEAVGGGAFHHAGPPLMAGSRLLVQENVHDEVVEKLDRRLATLRVGNPLDANTDVGPVLTGKRLDRTRDLVPAGEDEGAQKHQAASTVPDRGYFHPPTFFTGVAQSHTIALEEIPGPVLSLLTFRTPDEAVARANNTCHGLAAGVWSDKGSKVLEVAGRIRAGVVWGNAWGRLDPASPIGGYKESGTGRDGGLHGLRAYLEVR